MLKLYGTHVAQEAPFWCDLTVPIGIRHSTGASEHGDSEKLKDQ